jgi:hypothetical protein
MHNVERMTQSPPQCIFCGAGNTPYEDTKNIGPFIDTERDTGWGDPIYICHRDSCAGQVAVLAGWVSPDTARDLERTVRRLQKELHDARSSQEIAERRARARVTA